MRLPKGASIGKGGGGRGGGGGLIANHLADLCPLTSSLCTLFGCKQPGIFRHNHVILEVKHRGHCYHVDERFLEVVARDFFR